jgi:hypothetical protein
MPGAGLLSRRERMSAKPTGEGHSTPPNRGPYRRKVRPVVPAQFGCAGGPSSVGFADPFSLWEKVGSRREKGSTA